jgi:hypothetical protein
LCTFVGLILLESDHLCFEGRCDSYSFYSANKAWDLRALIKEGGSVRKGSAKRKRYKTEVIKGVDGGIGEKKSKGENEVKSESAVPVRLK